MKPMDILPSAVLLVSAVNGGYILATDSALWSVAPSHAYGLLAFTVFDIFLAVGLWKAPRAAIVVAVLFGLLQLSVMVGDIFLGTLTFSSNSTTSVAFSSHLLGDAAFETLLGIQVVLIAVGIAAFVMSRNAHGTT
jgi:hypothetical protein